MAKLSFAENMADYGYVSDWKIYPMHNSSARRLAIL